MNDNCDGKIIDYDMISRRVLVSKIFEIKEECRPAFLNAVMEAIQNCQPYELEQLKDSE